MKVAIAPGIPIDNQYYLTNQLKEPLKRLFSPVMKNPDSLFNGAHTLKVGATARKTGGAAKAGSLMSFVRPPQSRWCHELSLALTACVSWLIGRRFKRASRAFRLGAVYP